MTARRLLALVLVAGLASGLAACGRKGNPLPPDDAVYPRQYPYTPLPSRISGPKPAGDGPAQTAPSAEDPFQPPEPRLRNRPDELKPPAQ